MNTRTTSAFRIAAGSTAAVLVMCTLSLIGTANATIATDNNGAVGARPFPSQDPTTARGFQDAPFFTNNSSVYGATLQVTVPNRWKSGDQLTVVLPTGVSVLNQPSVTVAGPTTQTSILTHATTVILPVEGVQKPTVTTIVATDPDGAGRATMTFTNASTGPEARFVLNVGLTVKVTPQAKQGPLSASVYGIDTATAPGTLLARTTLAYVTNVKLRNGLKLMIPGGGPQPFASITLSESETQALVDGTYDFSFSVGDPGSERPVPVADPNPRGTRFDVGVSGGASLGAGGATASGNTLTVLLAGLHADGSLETLVLSGVRLDPPAGSRNIRVTLTKIADTANPTGPSPSDTQTAFTPINTPNSGNSARGANTLLPSAGDNESRVPGAPGINSGTQLGTYPDGSQIGGYDRYATAAQVAQQLARSGKDITTFVIASGDARSNGVDALSASYLAGVLAKKAGAAPVPVLLIKPGELPDATAQALHNLLTARTDTSAKAQVYVIGGSTAVSQAAVDEVKSVAGDSVPNAADVSVTRVGGADRYATAAAVATQQGAAAVGAYVARFGQTAGSTVFLSNGLIPADALSAGPIAYRRSFPVLLSQPAFLPQATVDAMKNDQVRNVILLGGTTAVSDAVFNQLKDLGFTVTRVAGADRYATNTALYGFTAHAAGGTAGDVTGGLGYPSPTTALLANGLVFADAMTAGPLAAEGLPAGDGRAAVAANAPLLLTSPAALSAATAHYLNGNRATIDTVTGIGLDTALPASVLAAANAAVK